MIDGKVLVTKESEVDGPLEVWGVWIPRRGDNAIFALEVAVEIGVVARVQISLPAAVLIDAAAASDARFAGGTIRRPVRSGAAHPASIVVSTSAPTPTRIQAGTARDDTISRILWRSEVLNACTSYTARSLARTLPGVPCGRL